MLTLLLALTPVHAATVSEAERVDQSDSGYTPLAGEELGTDVVFGDFNGDGYDDMATGAPGQDVGGDSSAGLVSVHYGSASGFSGFENINEDVIAPGTQPSNRFGRVLAAGDFDGDGADDLAVGMPDWDQNGPSISTGRNSGRIVVLYGSTAHGLMLTSTTAVRAREYDQTDYGGNGPGTDDRFGSSLAVGDFDGDGADDLAIGVPYEDLSAGTDCGRVVVHYGQVGSGLGSDREAFNQGAITGISNAPYDLFGFALAAGDFNDDGRDDLAIGIPQKDVGSASGSGTVAVKYGTSGGLKAGSSEVITQSAFPGRANEGGDRMGQTLAAGNIDGRGADDLVIGIPHEDLANTDTGLFGVLFGSSSGLLPTTSPLSFDSSSAGLGADANEYFASSLAVGDLDNDGEDDIIVGAPYEDSTRGRIAVYFGRFDRNITSGDNLRRGDFGGALDPYTYFGQVLATGDIDGDGRENIGVGTPYAEVSGEWTAGEVAVGEISP